MVSGDYRNSAPRVNIVKDKNGVTRKDEEEIKVRLKEYFAEFYNDPNDVDRSRSFNRVCSMFDIDEMVAPYNREIKSLLDQLLSLRQDFSRQRTSDPSFDTECHEAKRRTCRLEHAKASASPVAGPPRLLT